MELQTERRNSARYPGVELYLMIERSPFPLIELSSGYLAFEGDGYQSGDLVDLRLVHALDESDGALATVEIVRIDGFRVAARIIQGIERLNDYMDRHIQNHFPQETRLTH